MDFYFGQIVLFAFTNPIHIPTNFLVCDGRLLNLTQNEALYLLLGTAYGGDGINNFALPDLRKASPISGSQYCICTNGIFPYNNN